MANFLSLEGGCSAADLLIAASTQGLAVKDFADLRSVTSQEVSAAAAAVLQSTPSLAASGQTFGFVSYDSVRKMLH